MSLVHAQPRSSVTLLLVYLLALAGSVAGFFAIREFGERLAAPAPLVMESGEFAASAGGAVRKPAGVDVTLHVLATLAAILGLGRLFAWGFRLIGQPAVIGEVVAGIVLGPSVLGLLSPAAMHLLIPDAVADPHRQVLAALKMIAQLGVVFYMFIVGLELNLNKLGRQAHAAIAISHASILFPFLLGALLAVWLYPLLSTSAVPFTSFALFLGVAMAITAFPVLARILTDRRLHQTDLGTLALSCAATDDVTAWCLLAFVVGVAQAQVGNAFLIVGLSVLFIAAVFLVARPLIVRWVNWAEPRGLDQQAIPFVLIAVLCSALITEAIGIHAVFGAFLLGAMIPHDSRLAHDLIKKLHEVVTLLLLPAFFAIAGMNTRIGLVNDWTSLLMCGVIILIATLGKFGGTVAAARFVGIDWRSSAALGVLMNTRGLMELIVLNIGLSLGVISPKLFTMMVLMALATTIATAPILRLLIPDPQPERAPQPLV